MTDTPRGWVFLNMDFGDHLYVHEGVTLTCKRVAPSLTLHDLTMAFHEAKSKAKPGDEYAGDPSKWPDTRGVTAVLKTIMDAIAAAPQPDAEAIDDLCRKMWLGRDGHYWGPTFDNDYGRERYAEMKRNDDRARMRAFIAALRGDADGK